MRRFALLLLLSACDGKIQLEGDDDHDRDVEDVEDVAAICEESTPEVLTLTVTFPEPEGGCAWGEDGNGEALDAHIQARVEQTDGLELPEDAVICGATFDFEGVNGGEGTPMVYDDVFLFAFNDVVLASSHAALLQALPTDGIYATYDWDAIVGQPLEFGEQPTYCLGEDDGLAECDIPPPETRDLMSISFDQQIVDELALLAVEQGRYDFLFVTMGDNDGTDCSHAVFSFEVEVPYVAL